MSFLLPLRFPGLRVGGALVLGQGSQLGALPLGDIRQHLETFWGADQSHPVSG